MKPKVTRDETKATKHQKLESRRMFTDLVDLKKLDLKREEKPRNDSESHPQ